MAHKVCPVVYRTSNGIDELLAFRHPSAGKQFVKGSIKEGEAACDAALRELAEESGIQTVSGFLDLGEAPIGEVLWHFFAVTTDGLPDRWAHQTQDDLGHVFTFFWHPLAKDLDYEWHSQFHEALSVIRRAMPK